MGNLLEANTKTLKEDTCKMEPLFENMHPLLRYTLSQITEFLKKEIDGLPESKDKYYSYYKHNNHG
jgi:hypothetical protein